MPNTFDATVLDGAGKEGVRKGLEVVDGNVDFEVAPKGLELPDANVGYDGAPKGLGLLEANVGFDEASKVFEDAEENGCSDGAPKGVEVVEGAPKALSTFGDVSAFGANGLTPIERVEAMAGLVENGFAG